MGVEFPRHAVGESIRGIDEDEVELPRGRVARNLAQPAADVGPDQLGPLAEPEALHVAERRPGVVIDEQRRAGAARERLDRQRPRAAEEVEDAGAVDPVSEHGEDRLADPVGGRADLPAARRDQALPLELSGDHAHTQ